MAIIGIAVQWSRRALFMFLAFLLAAPALAADDGYFPGSSWRVSEPAAQGMDPALLRQMQERYGSAGSVVVIRNGYLVSGPGRAAMEKDAQHVHSCTKSVVSILAGIAIAEGFVPNADAPVTRFLSGNADWDSVTLGQLLSMRSGIQWNDAKHPTDSEIMSERGDWLGYIASKPLVSKPGSAWNYNSGGTQLAAFALERAVAPHGSTSRNLADYAREKLFSPMGIRPSAWWSEPGGGSTAGWGLFLTPFDMSKLGFLMLRGGRWGKARLVPEAWIAESTRPAGPGGPDGGFSYGYSWWIYEGLATRAYKACGQYGDHRVDIIVLPELDVVVVLAGGNLDDRGILARYVIPAVSRNPEAGSVRP